MDIIVLLTVAASVILIALIALQEQSSDTPGAFGGGAGSGFYQTRRGLEKFMFGATVFFAVLFVCLSLLNLVIPAL
jgi:protein translocase SecG subunit